MNKKKVMTLVFLAGFVLLLGGSYLLYHRLSAGVERDSFVQEREDASQSEDTSGKDASSETAEFTPAPDFTVYDSDGNKVNLSDFAGTPVIVNFWASWCGPCKSEMPDFDAAFLKHGEEIQFLMVNMTDGSRETVEKASAFIEEQGYSFPVYFDSDLDAAITYGVSSIPTTFLINEEGNIIAYAKGAIHGEALAEGVQLLLP